MVMADTLVSVASITTLYALLALGLNVKFGYAGLIEIGHVGFYLIGAYTTALLVMPPAETINSAQFILGFGWSWVPAILAGTIAAGIAGGLVALPAIRLREDYLAVTLLGVSIILQRVVQSERWLANGPRSLQGYSLPLEDLFPLQPAASLAGALALGGLVFLFWAAMTYSVSQILGSDRLSGSDSRVSVVVLHAAFALTSLAVPYLAARLTSGATVARRRRWLASVGAGLVVGLAAVVVPLATGSSTLAFLLFLGSASLFTWVLGYCLFRRHYAGVERGAFLWAFGLSIAVLAVFLPVVLFHSQTGGWTEAIPVLATTILLSGLLYGIYRLFQEWPVGDTETQLLSILGITTVMLFVWRYFVLDAFTSLQESGVVGVQRSVLLNLLWMIGVNNGELSIGYNRFFLFVVVAVTAGTYVLLQLMARSPYGRVLKSIREDENVTVAIGKNVFRYKVESMILGSAIAGLAGGLTAIYYQTLNFSMFLPQITFIVLLMLVIGGRANNAGMVLGAMIYWLFQKSTADLVGFFPDEIQASIQALRLVAIGTLLIIILMYRPEGLWPEQSAIHGEGVE